MGMIGNYRRLTIEQLTALQETPDSVFSFVYPEDDSSIPPDSNLSIDKTWHAIHFCLTRDPWGGEPPLVYAVLGGVPLGDDDLGYGPARFLTAE